MPVVNFLACLDLEQNISFLDRHEFKLISFFVFEKLPISEMKPLFYINSVFSLRSFNHKFTRFEKKHYLWSDRTNKNTPAPELNI